MKRLAPVFILMLLAGPALAQSYQDAQGRATGRHRGWTSRA